MATLIVGSLSNPMDVIGKVPYELAETSDRARVGLFENNLS